MIQSINPATEQIRQTYSALTSAQIECKLVAAKTAWPAWRRTTFSHRQTLLQALAQELRNQRQTLAALITAEMGCPLAQTQAEIEKCAVIAELAGQEAGKYLVDKPVKTQAKTSYIRFEPVGTVLHIAPWNYPFYLALRPVVSALAAGNCVVLKPASNTPECALALEAIFEAAKFPRGVFSALLVSSSQVPLILEHESVQMVTLIGSEKAGSAVGQLAGKNLKKSLLELGGSDPMLVLAGADLGRCVEGALYSRLRNAGQSCNAAKRFLVPHAKVDEFCQRLSEKISQTKVGDPSLTETALGPLATAKSRLEVTRQVEESVKMGAVIANEALTLPAQGYYFSPVVLREVRREMPVMREEVFGPVFPVFGYDSLEEAVQIANDSPYGLGASVWGDVETVKSLIPEIEAGNVYVNKVVRGDPKLPFGGVKKTGYGREFGEYGLLEFVNLKSVVIES